MSARLLEKLDKEDGEFVRPALTRALAAYGDEPRGAEGAGVARDARPGLCIAAP